MRWLCISVLIFLVTEIQTSIESISTTMTFKDETNYYKEHGHLYGCSNTTVSFISGQLFEPRDQESLATCADASNITHHSVPGKPFIIFLPVTNCSAKQAKAAKDISAVGIVFHSALLSSKLPSCDLFLRNVVVTLLILTDTYDPF